MLYGFINCNLPNVCELEEAFPTEQSCIDHLEQLRWNGYVVSPFDPSSKVYNCKGNRYKCKNTGKYFNVKTNTVFHGSKISLKTWFRAIHQLEINKHISSCDLSIRLGITQKTSWFIMKKIKQSSIGMLVLIKKDKSSDCELVLKSNSNYGS